MKPNYDPLRLFFLLAIHFFACAQKPELQTGMLEVANGQIYYEVIGQGAPLVAHSRRVW